MKSYLRHAVVSLGLLFSFAIYGQRIEVEFNVSADNLDSVYEIADYKLTLGVDSSLGPEGLGPGLDDSDIPAAPPSLFVTTIDPTTGTASPLKSKVVFGGNETPLIEEFKPTNDSLVWRLQLEFGDPEVSGEKTKITLAWDNGSGGSLFSAFTDYDIIELKDGDTTVVLKTTDTSITPPTAHTFEGDPGELREALIVFREDNIAPVALSDSFALLKNQENTFDLIKNDIDPDGTVDDLKIKEITSLSKIEEDGSLSAVTDGTTVNVLEPDRKSVRVIAGSEQSRVTFDYTVEDPLGGEGTGTVTVTIDDVVATRSHPDIAVTGTSDGAGLEVEVVIEFNTGVGGAIVLTETFPRSDTALDFWFIPSGSGPNELDISDPTTDSTGILPDSVEEVGDVDFDDSDQTMKGTISNAVKFTWNSPASSPIVFQYRIVSKDFDPADRSPKTISGVINHGTNTTGPEVSGENTFLPSSELVHPADTDKNLKISDAEKNTFFARPTLIVKTGFERCGNQAEGYPYTVQDNKFIPCPDTGADCSACGASQIHPADTEPQNQKISDAEKNKFFARPTLIVKNGFERCGNQPNGFPYVFDGNNFIPDASVPCE